MVYRGELWSDQLKMLFLCYNGLKLHSCTEIESKKCGLRLGYIWGQALTQTVFIIRPTKQPLYRIHDLISSFELQKTKKKTLSGQASEPLQVLKWLRGKTFPLTPLRVYVTLEDHMHSWTTFFASPFYLHEPSCNVGPVNHSSVFVCV